jgi:hypothetical protein
MKSRRCGYAVLAHEQDLAVARQRHDADGARVAHVLSRVVWLPSGRRTMFAMHLQEAAGVHLFAGDELLGEILPLHWALSDVRIALQQVYCCCAMLYRLFIEAKHSAISGCGTMPIASSARAFAESSSPASSRWPARRSRPSARRSTSA